jgi:hypothetical protein
MYVKVTTKAGRVYEYENDNMNCQEDYDGFYRIVFHDGLIDGIYKNAKPVATIRLELIEAIESVKKG